MSMLRNRPNTGKKESATQLLPQSDIKHQNPVDDCKDDVVSSEGNASTPYPSIQTKLKSAQDDVVSSEGNANTPKPSIQARFKSAKEKCSGLGSDYLEKLKSAQEEYLDKITHINGKRGVIKDVVIFEPVVEHDIGMLGSALHYCLGMTPSSSIQAQSTEKDSDEQGLASL